MRVGCPIRKPQDHSSVTSSPGLIAGSSVLHRLSTPRHPSRALMLGHTNRTPRLPRGLPSTILPPCLVGAAWVPLREGPPVSCRSSEPARTARFALRAAFNFRTCSFCSPTRRPLLELRLDLFVASHSESLGPFRRTGWGTCSSVSGCQRAGAFARVSPVSGAFFTLRPVRRGVGSTLDPTPGQSSGPGVVFVRPPQSSYP